ncbi:MAG: glycine/D-amino acid oxidase-like deaminating enzyme [Candidatus Azotimanducaceae bacterium]|jgi:glycine/D-amino acid oxidase-like deaminating enzyme
MIQNERATLADSLWSATANDSPERPALTGVAEADTVVIGGGFTGLSAALHLVQAGQSVILLEAETPGWGASGRNGGQVNPGLKANPQDIEATFGPEMGKRMVALSGGAGKLVFDLIRRHSIECDANECGWVRSATNSKALAELHEIARQWRVRGHDVDEVSGIQMSNLLGSAAYEGGIIDRRGGNIHPLNFALGLASAAEKAGVRIFGDSRVNEVKSTQDNVTVVTAQGQVTAKRALICTNAYTGDLMPPLGQTVVPVTSVQVATAPLSENVAKSILPLGHSPTDTRRLIFYFRKDAAGRFIMGGRGAMGDTGIRKRQAGLRDAALQLYHQIGEVEWTHAWGGNVAMTSDHAPGLHQIAPNIVAALGYNGRGVGMATAMGTVLAHWAQGVPAAALDFPMTPAKPIPFYRFRNIGVGATIATFRIMDRFGL